MVKKQAKVVPEPAKGTRTVLAPPKNPAISTGGVVDVVCGKCGAVIAKGMGGPVQFKGVLVKCASCGALNDIDP